MMNYDHHHIFFVFISDYSLPNSILTAFATFRLVLPFRSLAARNELLVLELALRLDALDDLDDDCNDDPLPPPPLPLAGFLTVMLALSIKIIIIRYQL